MLKRSRDETVAPAELAKRIRTQSAPNPEASSPDLNEFIDMLDLDGVGGQSQDPSHVAQPSTEFDAADFDNLFDSVGSQQDSPDVVQRSNAFDAAKLASVELNKALDGTGSVQDPSGADQRSPEFNSPKFDPIELIKMLGNMGDQQQDSSGVVQCSYESDCAGIDPAKLNNMLGGMGDQQQDSSGVAQRSNESDATEHDPAGLNDMLDGIMGDDSSCLPPSSTVGAEYSNHHHSVAQELNPFGTVETPLSTPALSEPLTPSLENIAWPDGGFGSVGKPLDASILPMDHDALALSASPSLDNAFIAMIPTAAQPSDPPFTLGIPDEQIMCRAMFLLGSQDARGVVDRMDMFLSTVGVPYPVNLRAGWAYLEAKVGIDERNTRRKRKGSGKNKPKPRDTSTMTWWAGLKLSSDELGLSDSECRVVAKGIGILASCNDSLKALNTKPSSSSYEGRFCNAVIYMDSLDMRAIEISIIQIATCIFFHIAAHDDPIHWSKKSRTRLGTLDQDDYDHLYDQLKCFLPKDINKTRFVEEYKGWREVGSCYAFLAWKLSLGSLVHLRRRLRPDQMWGCSKGGEKRHNLSVEVPNHLLAEGIADMAVASGAEDLMHDLLWALFDQSLGFTKRNGGEKFPGFEREINTEREEKERGILKPWSIL